MIIVIILKKNIFGKYEYIKFVLNVFHDKKKRYILVLLYINSLNALI